MTSIALPEVISTLHLYLLPPLVLLLALVSAVAEVLQGTIRSFGEVAEAYYDLRRKLRLLRIRYRKKPY